MDELLVGVEKELAEGDAGHDDQATHKFVIHKHFPLALKAKSEFEEKQMILTQDAPEVISHTFFLFPSLNGYDWHPWFCLKTVHCA